MLTQGGLLFDWSNEPELEPRTYNFGDYSAIPKNQYVGDTSFPVTHINAYQSDDVSLAGPTSAENLHFRLLLATEDTEQMKTDKSTWTGLATTNEFLPYVSVDFSDEWQTDYAVMTFLLQGESGIIYASARFAVFAFQYTGLENGFVEVGRWSEINYGYDGHELSHEGEVSHAAYWCMNKDEELFVPRANNIYKLKFNAEEATFDVLGTTTVDSFVHAIQITYDGHIASLQKNGVLRIFDFGLRELQSVVLPHPHDEEVSNGFSVDENNNFYIALGNDMYMYHWDTNANTIEQIWRFEGVENSEQMAGRLGEGIGSTPSILALPNGNKAIVATDGSNPMNVHIIDARTGEDMVNYQLPQNFTSEQSVVVAGTDIFIVNNYWENFDDYTGTFCCSDERIEHLCPTYLGALAYGVKKLHFDPDEQTLTEVWHNSISCASSIPMYSKESDVVYCLGGKDHSDSPQPVYTLAALNWTTGDVLFEYDMVNDNSVNPYYSMTGLYDLGNGVTSFVYGSVAGLVEIYSDPTKEFSPITVDEPSKDNLIPNGICRKAARSGKCESSLEDVAEAAEGTCVTVADVCATTCARRWHSGRRTNRLLSDEPMAW